MTEYHDPEQRADLDLGDEALNAALARVFESGALRRAFDRLTDPRHPRGTDVPEPDLTVPTIPDLVPLAAAYPRHGDPEAAATAIRVAREVLAQVRAFADNGGERWYPLVEVERLRRSTYVLADLALSRDLDHGAVQDAREAARRAARVVGQRILAHHADDRDAGLTRGIRDRCVAMAAGDDAMFEHAILVARQGRLDLNHDVVADLLAGNVVDEARTRRVGVEQLARAGMGSERIAVELQIPPAEVRAIGATFDIPIPGDAEPDRTPPADVQAHLDALLVDLFALAERARLVERPGDLDTVDAARLHAAVSGLWHGCAPLLVLRAMVERYLKA